MPVSLVKSPLFLMLDTETIFLRKKAYEIAFLVFDSVSCQVITKGRFLIAETIKSALWYTATNGATPIFWPHRLDMAACLRSSDCVPLKKALDVLCKVIKDHDINAIIAHNVQFDISALYSTEAAYCEPSDCMLLENIGHINKLELSGYFVHNLAKNTAFEVPYKAKSGCVTFKADYLVPFLTGGVQAHDALGDCLNQLAIYKLTNGRYANKGSIFGNMKAYHENQHNGGLRLGNREIE